ncbi:serine hydrolase [Lutimonas halocynthiae]|uniref:serine hydrolase n=1 Tax=Lutimonas halocynthiae TaxID=1446477 RepID=UPI0025B5BDDF|nr:serine hydrolase [Lutimonas halocynthiae]MDN3643060.1 serine hydrolase [Lutimonas halocynthiae]
MKNLFLSAILLLSLSAVSQEINIKKSLSDFDKYMESALTDWNAPGVGVAVIHGGELVYVKGYGFRDYGKKLPVTKNTLFQIASNTKLFTTVAAGMLVEEGVFTWDQPFKESVPEIEFYNDLLNTQVTLRDMLSHKTGVSRHDMIWFQSDFNRKELFDRMKFLEPSKPIRQDFIYNNLMYTSVGYAIELRTGKTWEAYIREKLFSPLEMNNTVFSIEEMQKSDDHGVPYSEKRDTTLLYQIPLKEDGAGVGPAGSIITNLEELSHWVIAIMNDGKYKDKQVFSKTIIDETMKPGIGFKNQSLEDKGYDEVLNSVYGMGRGIEIYKGHVLTNHGGAMPGFHSQVIIMPYDDIGIITFSIGDHAASLGNTIVGYNLVDRLLGLEQTDWNGRLLKDYKARKVLGKQARGQEGFDRVADTKPTHAIEDYVGTFANEAYGEFKVDFKRDSLFFNFRRTELSLTHYHYNRFDTPNDEDFGKWTINFNISPQGDIDNAIVSIDEGQVVFVKKPDGTLSEEATLEQYVGRYDYGGSMFDVKLKQGQLAIIWSVDEYLIPYKKHLFKMKNYDDQQIEFNVEQGKVTGLKIKAPAGIYECKKME